MEKTRQRQHVFQHLPFKFRSLTKRPQAKSCTSLKLRQRLYQFIRINAICINSIKVTQTTNIAWCRIKRFSVSKIYTDKLGFLAAVFCESAQVALR